MNTATQSELAARISELQARVDAAAPLAELEAGVRELRRVAEDGGDLPSRIRVRIAQGIIENRQGKHEQALATAYEAQQLASDEAGAALRSRISRLIATIYSWRGSGERAMAELLRAVAEARTVGSEQEMVAALADGGRACKEIKRYDLALAFFEAVLATTELNPLERQRALVIQLEMLNRLGRHSECLAAVQANEASTAAGSPRTRFLWHLEKAKALAGVERPAEAASLLAEAKDMLSGLGDYEPFELSEAEHEVELLSGGSANAIAVSGPADGDAADPGVDRLQRHVERFRRDGLHEREADARIELAQHFHRRGDLASAVSEAAAAVAVAVRQREPRIEERARSTMLQLGAEQWQQAADDRRGLVLDRYLLGETLGQGGYGLVKRAYDMQNGSERAIKFIDIESVGDPAKRKQLLDDARREVETASRLRHPGLVRVHSLIVDGETIAIVQDLVRGAPLELRRGEKLDPLAALDLFVQLAHALTALHQAGLVHRDLKPGNVMVDTRGRPVLIDLGLAAVAGAIEEDGPLRGTRNYVAPELLVSSRRAPPDPLQDIYALGVMLAEFLPGEALARPGGFFARAALGRAEPVAELVRRMRSRDPVQRPRTMAEISAVLEQRRAALAVGS